MKAPRTGVSTEGGEATAANLKWFVLMDEVMGHRPAITLPNPISSAMVTNSAAVASPQEKEGESTPCSKPKREPEWLSYVRKMEEKEEEKERRADEREEQKEREELQREERKEREKREEDRRERVARMDGCEAKGGKKREQRGTGTIWPGRDFQKSQKRDFRLSRRAMHGLQRLLRRDQDHGWGQELEVLIYVYWLAHGLSYRVVSSVDVNTLKLKLKVSS